MTPINEKITLKPDGHPITDKLVGKRIWYCYESGEILEQHYIDKYKIVWTGIEGSFTGHAQEERYQAFEIGEALYYLTWCEEGTIASSAQGVMYKGAYPVCVVADLKKLIATAVYINPNEDGGDDFIIDQAHLEIQS